VSSESEASKMGRVISGSSGSSIMNLVTAFFLRVLVLFPLVLFVEGVAVGPAGFFGVSAV
jgi:hypothetical protein